MIYTITPAKSGDYLLVEVHGEFSSEVAMQWTLEAHKLGKELGISKHLVDVTDAVNTGTPLDQYRFAYPGVTEEEMFDRYAKIAVLASPDDHSHDFVETVCRNIGLNLKLFRNREEAMTFLGLGPQQANQSG